MPVTEVAQGHVLDEVVLDGRRGVATDADSGIKAGDAAAVEGDPIDLDFGCSVGDVDERTACDRIQCRGQSGE